MTIGLHKEKVSEKEANDQEYAVKDGHPKPIQIHSFLHKYTPFLGTTPIIAKNPQKVKSLRIHFCCHANFAFVRMTVVGAHLRVRPYEKDRAHT